MYIIVDATHPEFENAIATLEQLYAQTNNSIFSYVYNLKETEAFMRLKTEAVSIPRPLMDLITELTLEVTDNQFLVRQIREDVSDWWPVNWDVFVTLREQGEYKGDRVEEIWQDRDEYRADADDIARDKRGLEPRPRFRDEREGDSTLSRE